MTKGVHYFYKNNFNSTYFKILIKYINFRTALSGLILLWNFFPNVVRYTVFYKLQSLEHSKYPHYLCMSYIIINNIKTYGTLIFIIYFGYSIFTFYGSFMSPGLLVYEVLHSEWTSILRTNSGLCRRFYYCCDSSGNPKCLIRTFALNFWDYATS